MKQPVDFIIIGSGIAGLYAAYKIKRISPPNTTILILEKNAKQWMGGRIGNDTFYGADVVVGAGVGRKNKDHALIQLLKETKVPYSEFVSSRNYVPPFQPVDLMAAMRTLKAEYKKHPDQHRHKTFKQFFIEVFGAKLYKDFVITTGYTDFENADIYETLYNYGMDDNVAGWTGLSLSWKHLVDTLYTRIGKEHFKCSSEVKRIQKIEDNLLHHPASFGGFEKTTADNKRYYAKKVVVATTRSVYYEPLSRGGGGGEFKSRVDFINKAQHPEKGMVLVGEMTSRHQGWVEGALESVDKVITRDWVNTV